MHDSDVGRRTPRVDLAVDLQAYDAEIDRLERALHDAETRDERERVLAELRDVEHRIGADTERVLGRVEQIADRKREILEDARRRRDRPRGPHAPRGATLGRRPRGRRESRASRPGHRRSSATRAGPGDDDGPGSDGDPAPSRLAELIGAPLANHYETHRHLAGHERLAAFLAQPPAVQVVSYRALREAIERRRGAR